MRIGHCIHGLGLGGAQRVVRLLIEGAGTHVEHVVYASMGGVFEREVRDAGGSVAIIPRHLAKLDPSWIFRLARAIRRDRVDVLHAHLFGDILHGCLAARLAGRVPALATLHNVAQAHTRLQRVGYRWLLPRMARVAACSDAVRASFVPLIGNRRVSFETVPNGVGAAALVDRRSARERLGLTGDALLIGAMGRLVEQKGFAYLIDAVARLDSVTARRTHLMIFGEGELRSGLQGEIERRRLGERVRMMGFRSDVSSLLEAFDVIAFGSVDEGLPMALLEAMAAGRCIVATDVGGVGDAVRQEVDGLLVPPREPARLGMALQRALGDDVLRARLGASASARFAANFTAARMVDRYEKIYADLHAGPRIATSAIEPELARWKAPR